MANSVLAMQASQVGRKAVSKATRRTVRRVSVLRWARLANYVPNFANQGKPTNAQLAGRRYEKQFGEWLVNRYGQSEVAHEPWIEFQDLKGRGLAAPDYLLWLQGRVVIFECKLTNTPTAVEQLTGLYMPLVERVFNVPTTLVVVCRGLQLGDNPAEWLGWERLGADTQYEPLLQLWRA